MLAVKCFSSKDYLQIFGNIIRVADVIFLPLDSDGTMGLNVQRECVGFGSEQVCDVKSQVWQIVDVTQLAEF